MEGAGAARHDDDGVPAPVPSQMVRTIALVDALLFVAAVVGARGTRPTRS